MIFLSQWWDMLVTWRVDQLKHCFSCKKKTGFVQVALAEQQIMLPIKGMNMWISIATSNVRGGRGGIELKTYATKNIRNGEG